MVKINDLCDDFIVGMHGGGEIYGHQKTNSQEALNKWLSKGIRFFEFDVSETTDHRFVAFAHRLDKVYLELAELSLPTTEAGCSLEWFLSTKLFPYSTQGLSTLSLDQLFKLLQKDASIILMLDLFAADNEEVKRFAQYLQSYNDMGLLSKVLIEIYDLTKVDILREYIPDIDLIYGVQPNSEIWPNTVNLCTDLDFDYIQTLKSLNIRFISFQWHYRNNCPDGIKTLSENSFCILSHIDNDLNADFCRKEGVNILLVDYYYGVKHDVCAKFQRFVIRQIAQLRINCGKFLRAGLRGSIKKVIKRL